MHLFHRNSYFWAQTKFRELHFNLKTWLNSIHSRMSMQNWNCKIACINIVHPLHCMILSLLCIVSTFHHKFSPSRPRSHSIHWGYKSKHSHILDTPLPFLPPSLSYWSSFPLIFQYFKSINTCLYIQTAKKSERGKWTKWDRPKNSLARTTR